MLGRQMMGHLKVTIPSNYDYRDHQNNQFLTIQIYKVSKMYDQFVTKKEKTVISELHRRFGHIIVKSNGHTTHHDMIILIFEYT